DQPLGAAGIAYLRNGVICGGPAHQCREVLRAAVGESPDGGELEGRALRNRLINGSYRDRTQSRGADRHGRRPRDDTASGRNCNRAALTYAGNQTLASRGITHMSFGLIGSIPSYRPSQV